MVNEQIQDKEKIVSLVREYYNKYHKVPYKVGDRIQYAGRVYDDDDMAELACSTLDFWLTAGKYSDEFERGLSEYLNVKYCYFVNSGSSANLLAFMALTSPLLGERAIQRGDEIITVAAGFPTTVTPIIQYGAIPVFLDVTIPEYNIDVSRLEEALTERTKAVMVAHTLGNPFNLSVMIDFCKKHNLWLIEDNCDALGSEYELNGRKGLTGTFGDIGTLSFYPAHHITTGEGGAVFTNNDLLAKIVLSIRDWGRDCHCQSGVDNSCGHRYDGQYGELPKGYDHKFVYSNFGYNLKATDMQGAVGCAQLKKLPAFVEARRHNWKRLRESLNCLSDRLILPVPTDNSNPSWFGFLMTIRENSGLEREEIVRYIESKNIQTRMLFSGNLIKHPCFDQMRRTGEGYRVVGNLDNTDRIMHNSFWIGVYPGMTDEKIDYMVQAVIDSVNRK